jgi:hypothetical protein
MKSAIFDQKPRDVRALLVEFMRAVGCFADQNEGCVADPVEQRRIVGIRKIEGLNQAPQLFHVSPPCMVAGHPSEARTSLTTAAHVI